MSFFKVLAQTLDEYGKTEKTCWATREFTKRVLEMLSQLFVCREIDRMKTVLSVYTLSINAIYLSHRLHVYGVKSTKCVRSDGWIVLLIYFICPLAAASLFIIPLRFLCTRPMEVGNSEPTQKKILIALFFIFDKSRLLLDWSKYP